MSRTPAASLLIVLMTTSLAACMARHAEPEEILADQMASPPPTATETATTANTGAEAQNQKRSEAAGGAAAVAGASVVQEELLALGYVDDNIAEEEAYESDAPLAEPAPDAMGAPMPSPSSRRDIAQGGERAQSITPRKSASAEGRAAPMSVSASGATTTTAPMPTQVVGGMVAPSVPADVDSRDPRANSEEYTDHGVNGFTVVAQDALSTFSIDVDTASYTIARRKLNEGGLPPVAAVRVEEFVNYFDYDYTPPSVNARHPFNVHFEAFPDPFREGRHIMRVGVQAKEVPASQRPPLHLTFLVDVSGSMSSSDKLPMAQQALHMLVDSMQEGDTVALATYAGRVAEILPPTEVSNKRRIHDAISALESGGSTAMSSGLDLAYNLAQRSFEAGAENRVIVLSDGDANVGTSSWEDMLGQIKKHADSGVTMSTVGLGMGNYRDTLMEQLANKGDGNNYYIDSVDQARRVFVEQMGSTIVTVARDVKLQVEFHDDAVSAYRLIGYENRDIADRDFRNDRVDAGEIGAGHNVTAIYEVILKEGYDDTLATLRLRYEAPGADKAAVEAAMPFPESALDETLAQTSREARIAYAAATFAEILRQSPHTNEMSLDQLIAFTQQSARPGNADDAELLDLMKKARRLGAGNNTHSVAGH